MKEEVSQLSKFCEEIRGNLVRVLDEIEKYKKEDDQLKKDELRVQTERRARHEAGTRALQRSLKRDETKRRLFDLPTFSSGF